MEKKAQFSTFSNLIYVYKSIWKFDKKLILLLFSSTFIYPIFSYIWQFNLKIILDFSTGETNFNIKQIFIYVSAIVSLIGIINLFFVIYSNSIWTHYTNVRQSLIIEKNKKMMKVEYELLENPDFLDANQRAENACWDEVGLIGLMSESGELIKDFSIAIFGNFILASVNMSLSMILIFISILTALINNYANKYTKKKVWDPLASFWRKQNYMKWITTDFAVAKDIRLFSLKDWLINKSRKLNVIRYKAQKKNENIWIKISLITNILWVFGQIIVYIWLLQSIFNSSISLGNFSFYLSSAIVFFDSVSNILNRLSTIIQRSREVSDFRYFMNFSEYENKNKNSEIPYAKNYEFEFKNVFFKYPNCEDYVLKNVSLKISDKETLALVGLNGAGKSTFIKLLLRLYTPTEGEILLNGKNISTFDKEKYFQLFSVIFQDTNIFAFPFAENIALQESCKIDNFKLSQTIKEVELDNCISKLPNGINTEILKEISVDGVDLSGGEKQKITIARAIYKNAPIMILDEPTSALDPLAESKIYAKMNKITKDKLAIYVTHRLSSTKFCNNIALFIDGEIVEYGNHSKLIKKNGLYAELFNIQAKYFSKEKNNE